MIDRLLKNVPAGDEDLTEAFDWYFLPSVNPDGYSYTWTDDRYWRKTRHVIPGNACIGVDANRNFPVGFGLPYGSSGSSCSESYRGEEAFSEMNAQNVRDFITPLAANGEIVYFQSLHAYSELVMYPWGYTEDLPVDADDQDRLGNIVSYNNY